MRLTRVSTTRSGQSVTSRSGAVLSLLLGLVALPSVAQPQPAGTGKIDTAPHRWQEVRLQKDLIPNRFVRRTWDGVDAIEVHSNAGMSLMARPLSVDLEATPVLCWRWRVDAALSTADMTQRQGDDYAARVYVSFRLPDSAMGLGLRTKLALGRAIWGANLPDAALNYVWDNRHPIGTEQPNVYTDRAIMVVQRSGNAQAGRWVQERRNVQEDVSRLFSTEAQAVQLAVTADTDNTGLSAHAGFADFHFVGVDAECQFSPVRP
jgi:Protein of unknown function (DUF3047)